jgi:peroxiredoxin (alkyl hydroperoxide reductase subunit C)
VANLQITVGTSKGGLMEEHVCGLRVGQSVPDLKIETFDPVKADFGEIDVAALGKAGKWTVLFFYPADFTFV